MNTENKRQIVGLSPQLRAAIVEAWSESLLSAGIQGGKTAHMIAGRKLDEAVDKVFNEIATEMVKPNPLLADLPWTRTEGTSGMRYEGHPDQLPPTYPRLEKPAYVAGATFGYGVSSRLVVEKAQRDYERKVAAPPKSEETIHAEEKARRELWEMVNGPLRAG